jgi:hypothetical protein
MQRSFARFTIGTMMGLIAVLGILSWLITGLVRYGTGLFGYPPLCLVVTFPFLFTLSITYRSHRDGVSATISRHRAAMMSRRNQWKKRTFGKRACARPFARRCRSLPRPQDTRRRVLRRPTMGRPQTSAMCCRCRRFPRRFLPVRSFQWTMAIPYPPEA